MPKRPEDRRSYNKHFQDQLESLGIQERFRRDNNQSSKDSVNVTVQMPEGNQAQEDKNEEQEEEPQTNWKLLIAAVIIAAYLTAVTVNGAIHGVEAGIPTILFHAALQGNFTPLENTLSSMPAKIATGVGVYDALVGAHVIHTLRRDV